MSIFKKITLLFFIGLMLILLIAFQAESINTQKVESSITEKYLQDAKKVFSWLIVLSPDTIEKKIHTLGLELVDKSSVDSLEVVFSRPHTFGNLIILKDDDSQYFLKINYFEDTLLLVDAKYQESIKEQWLLNLLLFFNVIVLIIIFLIMIRILFPLKEIVSKMQDFTHGDYDSRLDIKSKDEIGEVSRTYNNMAHNIQNLIVAREELLRDVGHELRTPIAKGYFALETLKESPQKDIISKSFTELERLISELLEIERLHALDDISVSKFNVETLILESLSKLMIEDESLIEINIEDNFNIKGDKGYLSTALKNLIDNAIKYAIEYPIIITAKKQIITVQNKGEALNGDLSYYLQPFTQEESSRGSKGYGLGLNIVKKILLKHDFQLTYSYSEDIHSFSIVCRHDKKTQC